MSSRNRILVVIAIIVVVGGGLGLLGFLQSQRRASATEPEPGMIHIYVDGRFFANVSPATVSELPQYSFKDAEEGKTQAGPGLADLLRQHLSAGELQDDTEITVVGRRSSTGEDKKRTLVWATVREQTNNVILDISNAGDSLKLVSTIPGFDTRDTWVQSVQRIDVGER